MGAVGIVALLTGCAVGDQALDHTVAAFTSAVAGGDTEAGCELLAPATRDALQQRSGGSCPSTLANARLPGGALVDTARWGREAQARTTTDTLFLTMTEQGWRVAAAGCSRREDAPYVCTVEGP